MVYNDYCKTLILKLKQTNTVKDRQIGRWIDKKRERERERERERQKKKLTYVFFSAGGRIQVFGKSFKNQNTFCPGIQHRMCFVLCEKNTFTFSIKMQNCKKCSVDTVDNRGTEYHQNQWLNQNILMSMKCGNVCVCVCVCVWGGLLQLKQETFQTALCL